MCNRLAILTLLATVLPAACVRADPPYGSPVQIQMGINPQFKVNAPDTPTAPWYLYWPSEAAHLYKAPGPMPYPYWPNPNYAAPTAPMAPPSAPVPTLPPATPVPENGGQPVPELDLGGTPLNPVGYFYRPRYWYGR